jgi:lipid II:glycine glycyltransferase (peptidoglycan interpeptide bridge formation enzyme)
MLAAMNKEHSNSPLSIEIDTVTEQQWNQLLEKFSDATIYQTWAYGAIRWGENNLSHLILKCNGGVIGIAQIAIKRLPLLNSGIAYIPWGPLWQEKDSIPDENNLCQLLRALRDEYAVKQKMLLRIAPNMFFDEGHISMIEQEGFGRQKSADPYNTIVIDISSNLEILRKNLDQKWRNHLNKAEKNDLVVEEGTDIRLFDIFIDLLKEMYERKNFPVGLDYNEFRKIQQTLPASHKMKIMVCMSQNEPVCATICSYLGNKGLYLLGATGNRGMKLNGSYLLQWRMIQWLKEQGCSFYDLCGINPKTNPNVYTFKRGLAGKAGGEIFHIGQFDAHNDIIGCMLSMLFDKVRKARLWMQALLVRFRGI